MAKIIGLPKLSPTMEEGTLTSWAKAEGDEVEIDELLAEVETDKAVMEFRSFDAGVLLKILVPEGETVVADYPVAIIGKAGEDIADLIKEAEAKMAASGGAAAAPPAEPAPAPEAAAPAATTSSAPAGVWAHQTAVGTPAPDRILASPVVRKIAREEGIDLRGVSGSGPGGRIVKRDLESHRGGGATVVGIPAVGFAPAAPRVEKLSQMRKTIARRLTESKQQVPHFYLTIDVDADPIWEARKQINAELEASGRKISVNDLLIKACAIALRRVPEVNATFRGDSIEYHGRVDISVAVAVPDGLMTPVVRNADVKGLLDINQEVRELAGRAKEKKLKPEEMMNGTFSISNLGMFGIDEFSAVINPPEGAILAVGGVRQEPVVRGGAVVPGRKMAMTLSCDHRVIDGAVGAQWLKALRGLLESPLRMLL